jgi:hypothetical protein
MSVRLTSSDTSNYAYLVRDISAASLATNGAFTMCGWFKPVVWTTYNPVLAMTNATSTRDPSFELMNASGDLASPEASTAATNGSGLGDSGFAMTTGGWVFRAYTTDGTGFNSWHYSGDENSATLTGYNHASALSAVGNFLIVGAFAVPGTAQALNGEVEHVRMWKAALTEPELRAERNATTPQKASPFLAWSLVNASDTADISGNSRVWTGTTVGTGTITNGASNSPPGAYSGSSPTGPRARFYAMLRNV